MAELKGFCGLRFTQKAGDKAEVCCPPYDIISAAEKAEFLRKNEHNIIRLELPEPTADGYSTAAEVKKEWTDSGILAADEKESIYI